MTSALLLPRRYADLSAAAFQAPKLAVGSTLLDPGIAAASVSLVSGTLYQFTLPLLRASTVTSLAAWAASAGTGLTGFWLVLLDPTRKVLGYTANLSASVGTAELDGTLAAGSGSAYAVPADGAYYFGVLSVFSTTTPTVVGITSKTSVTSSLNARAIASTTGLAAPPSVGTTCASTGSFASIILGGAL